MNLMTSLPKEWHRYGDPLVRGYRKKKNLKGSSKLNALTVDDGQDLKSISNSQHDATAKSRHEKAQEVFRQALVLPKHVTCKKTLVSYQHVSSDEAIAQMEDKAEASRRRTEKEM